MIGISTTLLLLFEFGKVGVVRVLIDAMLSHKLGLGLFDILKEGLVTRNLIVDDDIDGKDHSNEGGDCTDYHADTVGSVEISGLAMAFWLIAEPFGEVYG